MRLLLWLLRVSGFTKQYALVPVTDWNTVQDYFKNLQEMEATGKYLTGLTVQTRELLEQLPGIKQLAEEAHICAVGALPVSRVVATKIGDGPVVVTGLPDDPDPSKYMTKK